MRSFPPTFLRPQPITEAASLFCSLRLTMLPEKGRRAVRRLFAAHSVGVHTVNSIVFQNLLLHFPQFRSRYINMNMRDASRETASSVVGTEKQTGSRPLSDLFTAPLLQADTSASTGSQRPASSKAAASDGARSSEEEARRQAQWQKQIDYGKNTLGYQHYLKLIPK